LAPAANWARQRRVLTQPSPAGPSRVPSHGGPSRCQSQIREGLNRCERQIAARAKSLRDNILGGRVYWRLGVGEHSGVGGHNTRSSSICLLIASVPVPGALFPPVEFYQSSPTPRQKNHRSHHSDLRCLSALTPYRLRLHCYTLTFFDCNRHNSRMDTLMPAAPSGLRVLASWKGGKKCGRT